MAGDVVAARVVLGALALLVGGCTAGTPGRSQWPAVSAAGPGEVLVVTPDQMAIEGEIVDLYRRVCVEEAASGRLACRRELLGRSRVTRTLDDRHAVVAVPPRAQRLRAAR